MSTKTITPRKMIHALRYGKNVKQTTLAFKRIVSRKYPNDPYVIGSACALGKIGLTLDVDFINEEDQQVKKLCESCTEYMNDDFNTAMAMASLFELASKINSWQNQQAKISSIKKKKTPNVFFLLHLTNFS